MAIKKEVSKKTKEDVIDFDNFKFILAKEVVTKDGKKFMDYKFRNTQGVWFKVYDYDNVLKGFSIHKKFIVLEDAEFSVGKTRHYIDSNGLKQVQYGLKILSGEEPESFKRIIDAYISTLDVKVDLDTINSVKNISSTNSNPLLGLTRNPIKEEGEEVEEEDETEE